MTRWRRHWFEPAPLADLAIARLVVVAIVAWLDRGGRAAWVALAPPELFTPIAFLTHVGLSAQPTPGMVARVASVENALLVLAGLGIAARPALAGVFVLQLVEEAWVNSLGKVTHATVPLLYTMLFLALSPCDRALSVRALVRGPAGDTRSPDARWPIELVVVVLAAYYWKAGVAKLLDSGLAWADGATLQFYLLTNRLEWGTWLATFPAACAALAGLVLAFELASPLAIVRRLRWAVLGAGALFHLGTWWFLGISFWPLVAMYLVCVPWTCLGTRLGTRLALGLGVPLDTPHRARH